jgi:exonuclease SbcC
LRIRELNIIKYGPLSDIRITPFTDFNLLFGSNEEGKTLMIDSIVRFLFKKPKKIFQNLDRVDESPEGYLIMEMGNDEMVKFPEKGELTELTDISAEEYRNIFIIRSSDLFIEEEGAFYSSVQDKLTGLRTDELENIQKKLLDIGKLTPGGSFRNVKGEKLGERLEKAEQLIHTIEELKQKIEDQGLDKLEKELFTKKKSIQDIEKRLVNLNQAEKREKYEKSQETLNSLCNVKKQLESLENFNEEDENNWRDSERDIQEYRTKQKSLKKELAEKKDTLGVKNEKLIKKERDFLIYIERKNRLEEDINPEIRKYEQNRVHHSMGKVTFRIVTILSLLFAILFGTTTIAATIKRSIFLRSLSFVFLAFTLLSLIAIFWYIFKKLSLAHSQEKIKLLTEKYGLSGKTMDEIMRNITIFKEDFSKLEQERNRLEQDIEVLEREIKRMEENIPEIDKEIEKRIKEINKIKRKSRIETRDGYNRKLSQKRELNQTKIKAKGILKNDFGIKGKKEDEHIEYWKEKIKEYKHYKEKSPDIQYEEAEESILRNKKKNLSVEVEKIKESLDTLSDELSQLERNCNSVLKTTDKDYLLCRTTVELDEIKKRLKSFIETNEHRKDIAKRAIKIFKEIKEEEEKKVSSLFGKDSPVSLYFQQITDSKYTNVEYDTENRNIRILQKEGNFLNADKLSSGAYDQLYLSIRLALGEKILKGEKGFFIMDDPFVKSDYERLKKQLHILKELSQNGWQILYFSAKDEVRNCLKKEIQNEQILYFEM